jgi:hypothetical protein
MPAGRIVLAGAHSIGRAFNVPVRYTRRYALVRRVLGDNMAAYEIVRRLFQFAEETLDSAQPDILYAFEWATPLNFAFWLAATSRGIPCVALRYSKIKSDRAFFTTDRLMLNTDAFELANEKRRANASIGSAATDYIRAFREQPAVVQYIATKWKNRMQRNFLRWHVQNARVIVREFINGLRGQDKSLREPPLGRLSRYYHSIFLTYSQQGHMQTFDDKALAEMKYVYFPLHKEAELAQTFQATLWHDQRNTVRVLASMLPHGYRLLAREHRMNIGFRPTRSYRELAAIPNVVLIDAFDSQYKYLRHADLVVTENGSSGWEGLLLGRRVLTLSRTFYDAAGSMTKVVDPDELNAAILNTLAGPAVSDPEKHDRGLGWMIDAELETTFPMTKEAVPAALDRMKSVLGSAITSRRSPRAGHLAAGGGS